MGSSSRWPLLEIAGLDDWSERTALKNLVSQSPMMMMMIVKIYINA